MMRAGLCTGAARAAPGRARRELGISGASSAKLPRRDAQSWDSLGSPAPHGQALGEEAEGDAPLRALCSRPCGQSRVGAGGSFLPTGEEKQIHFSAFQRKGVSFFLMFQMYRDKRLVPRSVLFILCL